MRNRATPKLWTLDGAPVDVFEFMEANDLDSREVRDLLEMYPGETVSYGGGAAAHFTLERVK